MTRAALNPQIDNTLLTNLVGAISAENHRLLIHAIVDWALGPEDLKSDIAGNNLLAPFSQAGAFLLDQNLRQYVATTVAQVKSDLQGGVGPAFDTLSKLAAAELSDAATLSAVVLRLGALETAALTYVKLDGSTPFTQPQVGVPGTGSTHFVTVAQLDQGGGYFTTPSVVTVIQAGTTTPMGTTRPTEAGQPARVFVPTDVFCSLRSKGTGTIATAGVLTVGTNSTYDNIATIPLANVLTIGLNVQQLLSSYSIAAGTTIYCRVLTAQVGTASTTYDVFLRGFYRVLPS